MKEFEFNDCGVCTNPNRYGLEWRNEIRTAQCPDGKWVYGYSYNLDTPDSLGGGCGANIKDRERYSTEREAAIAGIHSVERSIAYRKLKRGDKRRAGIDAMIEHVFEKFTQLSLF